jgi:hypothetical protein
MLLKNHPTLRVVLISLGGAFLGLGLVVAAIFIGLSHYDGDPTAADGAAWQLRLTIGAAGVLVLMWGVRAVLCWGAAKVPPQTVWATAVVGTNGKVSAPYLQLMPVPFHFDPIIDDVLETSRRARWQRVLWHPVLEQLAPGTPVTVRIGDGMFRRAVICLPNGVTLWPAAQLRDTKPKRWRFAYRFGQRRSIALELERRAAGGDVRARRRLESVLRRQFNIRAPIPGDCRSVLQVVERRQRRRRLLAGTVAPLMVGAIAGFAYGWGGERPVASLAVAGLFFGLAMYGWGFLGGEPEGPRAFSPID